MGQHAEAVEQIRGRERRRRRGGMLHSVPWEIQTGAARWLKSQRLGRVHVLELISTRRERLVGSDHLFSERHKHKRSFHAAELCLQDSAAARRDSMRLLIVSTPCLMITIMLHVWWKNTMAVSILSIYLKPHISCSLFSHSHTVQLSQPLTTAPNID